LRFSMGQIIPFSDRFGLRNLSGRVVDDHFEILSVLCRIDGKLELAVFQFKFS